MNIKDYSREELIAGINAMEEQEFELYTEIDHHPVDSAEMDNLMRAITCTANYIDDLNEELKLRN